MNQPRKLPPRAQCKLVFGHGSYRFGDAWRRRDVGMRLVEVRSIDELRAEAADAHCVIASGLWRNDMLDTARNLVFVQSISAGVDQFDKAKFREAGVRLASAQGVNARAVAEHAIALMLALTRQVNLARDAQHQKHWRGMNGDSATREEVVAGKTMLLVGLGGIGERVARLAKAFDMTVIATRRDASRTGSVADEVHPQTALHALLPRADVVVLTCPLTPETENLIDARALALMKPTAYLINVARGRVADEAALTAALVEKRIAGAGLDVFQSEPLPADSPLWGLPQVVVTPHTAGETRAYEEDLALLFVENLGRIERGEGALKNQVV